MRAIIKNERTHERRNVILPTALPKRWIVQEILPQPKRTSEPSAPGIEWSEDLEDLAILFKMNVPELLDAGRAKFGTNVSIKGLILQLQTRGL